MVKMTTGQLADKIMPTTKSLYSVPAGLAAISTGGLALMAVPPAAKSASLITTVGSCLIYGGSGLITTPIVWLLAAGLGCGVYATYGFCYGVYVERLNTKLKFQAVCALVAGNNPEIREIQFSIKQFERSQKLREAFGHNCFIETVFFVEEDGISEDTAFNLLKNNKSVTNVKGIKGANHDKLAVLLADNACRPVENKLGSFFNDMLMRFHAIILHCIKKERNCIEKERTPEAADIEIRDDLLVLISNDQLRKSLLEAYELRLTQANAQKNDCQSRQQYLAQHYDSESQSASNVGDNSDNNERSLLAKTQEALNICEQRQRVLSTRSEEYRARVAENFTPSEPQKVKNTFLKVMRRESNDEEYRLLEQYYDSFKQYIQKDGYDLPMTTETMLVGSNNYCCVSVRGVKSLTPLIASVLSSNFQHFNDLLREGADPFAAFSKGNSGSVIQFILAIKDKSLRFRLLNAVLDALKERSIEEIQPHPNITSQYQLHEKLNQLKQRLDQFDGKLRDKLREEIVDPKANHRTFLFKFFAYYAAFHELLRKDLFDCLNPEEFSNALNQFNKIECFSSEIHRAVKPIINELAIMHKNVLEDDRKVKANYSECRENRQLAKDCSSKLKQKDKDCSSKLKQKDKDYSSTLKQKDEEIARRDQEYARREQEYARREQASAQEIAKLREEIERFRASPAPRAGLFNGEAGHQEKNEQPGASQKARAACVIS